jgi:hypothetical protein
MLIGGGWLKASSRGGVGVGDGDDDEDPQPASSRAIRRVRKMRVNMSRAAFRPMESITRVEV